MIKTVVFGGTFDPPHIGHKHLLESVMSEGYDSAIVIPAAVPPHKTRDGNDFENRFSLTKQMFADMPNVTVSDIENKRDGKSYTFDTLSILREQYPDRKLYLLMGSEYKTIPIAVQYLKGGYGSVDMGALMAMLVLSIIPVVAFYLLGQKYIVKGVAAGAVKG